MKAPRKQRDLQAQLKGNEGMLLKLVLKESGVGLLTQKHEYEIDVNKLSTISNQAMGKKVNECLRSKFFRKIQRKSNIRDREMSFGYNPAVEDPHDKQLPRKCYKFLPVRTRNAPAAITLKTPTRG